MRHYAGDARPRLCRPGGAVGLWVRGEPGEALRWTRKAIAERDPWLCWHKVDPPCIRPAAPEIQALLEDAGL